MTFKSLKVIKILQIDVDEKECCLHLSLRSLFNTRLPHHLGAMKTVQIKYQS